MPSYRDGLEAIPSVIAQLNADNIVATIEAANVGAYLYGFDGTTWDRLTATGGLLDINTELPAAVLLADNTATPTVPGVGAFLMVYDGATWDMARGTSALGLQVDTELPAAALLADNTATPTVPAVGAFGMVYDGATWDFMRGTAADGVTVNTELAAAALMADNAATPTVPAVAAFSVVYDGATWDFLRGNATAGVFVQGPAAVNAAVAGNPVWAVGMDTGSNLRPLTLALPNQDAIAEAGQYQLYTLAGNQLFDSAAGAWDRERNNTAITALTSAARTATTSSGTLVNYNAPGAMIFLNITANPGGAETLTLSVEVLGPISAGWTPITAFSAEAAATNDEFLYTIYPGASETTAVALHYVQALALPRSFRVTVTHSAAGSWTYSVAVSFIR